MSVEADHWHFHMGTLETMVTDFAYCAKMRPMQSMTDQVRKFNEHHGMKRWDIT